MAEAHEAPAGSTSFLGRVASNDPDPMPDAGEPGEGLAPSPEPCSDVRCSDPVEVLDWCKPHAAAFADHLFRTLVKRRDPDCRRCGKGTTDCAHIFTRSRWQTRWDPANAVGLCRSCHMDFTGTPLYWREWCIAEVFGGDERAFGELELRSTATERGAPKADLATIIERLEDA